MAAEKFGNLEGNWSIKRHIIDLSCVALGFGNGKASFVRAGNNKNVLLYDEILDLHLVGCKPHSGARQEYKFIYDIKADSISKYTSSENLMYRFEMGGEGATGTYLCNRDKYVAFYNFTDNNRFTLIYKVSGPEKNYTIITEFEKINEDILESPEIGACIMSNSFD